MSAAWMILLVLAREPAPSPAPPPPQTSVLFMPLAHSEAVRAGLAETLAALLTAQAGQLPSYRVTSFKEVQGSMSQEELRQVSGCTSASCAAEIAGAMATEQIVVGSVDKVGQRYVVNLSRIRARDAFICGRVVDQVHGDNPEALLDHVPSMIATLFDVPVPRASAGPPAAAEPAATAPRAAPGGPSVLPHVLRGAGLAAVGLAGCLAVAAAAVGIGMIASSWGIAAEVKGANLHRLELQGVYVTGFVVPAAGGVLALPLVAVAAALLVGSFVVVRG